MKSVKAIMAETTVPCAVGASLNEAARLMWDQNRGMLPVVDEQGEVVGVITDRDICMAAYTQGRCLSELQVSSAMAKEILSCAESDELAAVEKRMLDAGVHRLPVMSETGAPIGVVSLGEVVRAGRAEPSPAVQRPTPNLGVGRRESPRAKINAAETARR